MQQVFTVVVRDGDGEREISRLAACYWAAKELFQAEFGAENIIVGPWPLPLSDHIPPRIRFAHARSR